MKRTVTSPDKERPVHPTTTTERLGKPRVGEGALVWDPRRPKWLPKEEDPVARPALLQERPAAE